MKILAISLLRLGDLVMMTPALRGLKQQHPEAELHVLINRECRHVTPMIAGVDRWIEFDRQTMQHALGEFEASMLDGFVQVHELIESLASESYDFVVNLTHTRLSGWIAGMMDAEIRTGLGLSADGRAFIASGWFRYLNDRATSSSAFDFHYADIFYSGVGLEKMWHPIHLIETERGLTEAQKFQNGEPYILVQALTSDSKKNWELDSFVEALRLFAILNPQLRILLLGAPFEQGHLSLLQARLKGLRVNSELAITSLEGVLSLCHHAQLLITADTGVKHLASSTQCRILELSLGSSDLFKTGVYAPDNLILQSREACAPCPHSEPCSRPTHACGLRLSAECVALTASKLLHRDFAQLKIVADQYRDEVTMYRTEWSESGFWQAIPLYERFERSRVLAWIERTSWQMVLTGMHQQLVGEFGTYALRLSRLLTQMFPRQSGADWHHILVDLEKEIERHVQEADASEELALGRGEDFIKLRQMREQSENWLNRKSIELKIVRTLRTEMEK